MDNLGLYKDIDYKQIVKELYQQLNSIDNLPEMSYPGENYIQFNILPKYGVHFELWLIGKDGLMYLDLHQEKRTKELNDNFIKQMRTVIGSNEKYSIQKRERNKDAQIIRQSKAYKKDEVLNLVNEIAHDVIEMYQLFQQPILTYFKNNQNIESITEDMQYWILLCNPDKWFGENDQQNAQVNSVLFNLTNETWRVGKKQFSKAKVGDCGIIKVGEDTRPLKRRTSLNGGIVNQLEPGIYAIFEIVAGPKGEALWIDEDEQYRIKIEIKRNLYREGKIINKQDSQKLLGNKYSAFASESLSKEIYDKVQLFLNNEGKSVNPPLNQILYGPPGTGKTYHTINKAIEIIDNDFYQYHKEPTSENRRILKNKFEELKEAGQIVFTTFHQSYGYEEFVEGIKAEAAGNGIIYKVEPGMFKQLCQEAQKKHESKITVDTDTFELTKDIFETLYADFTNNLMDHSGNQVSNCTLQTSTKQNFDLYKNSTPSIVVKAGKERTSMSVSYSELEKVFFENKKPVYSSYEHIIIDKILEPLNCRIEDINNTKKHYILIIDEINRGNISKIFGELITLIEDSKRIGKAEEIRVSLPYSGMGDDDRGFGVPSNLYIVGTMNTADRSIALMDTALRRRFHFEEMIPNLEVLSSDDKKVKNYNSDKKQDNDLEVKEINIRLLLKKMNERIEYLYDRDHTIGHAYFMSLKEQIKDINSVLRDKNDDEKLLELESIFRNKIIPLLQEYFYDDWEKIRLILGDNQKEKNEATKALQFIKIKEGYDPKTLFGDTQHELLDNDDSTKVYEINKDAFLTPESYVKIYG